jgi:hypothetical protein
LGLSPEGWARKVAGAAEAWRAQRVVAEANNGGRMVESVLKGAGQTLPVRLVHASEGKTARAEPVAALFESNRAKLAGRFPALEDELAGLTYRGGYEGPGRSPDRADAMVWALTELLIDRPTGEPRGAAAVTFPYPPLSTTAVSALSWPAVGWSSRMMLRRVAGSGGRQLRLAPVVALPGAEKARPMRLAPGRMKPSRSEWAALL